MSPDRPSPKLIEAWIAGTLPDDVADHVERYFEAHPEELPQEDLTIDLLQEAANAAPTDTALADLMKHLMAGPSLTDQIGAPFLDLLKATDRPNLLGTLAQYDVMEVIASTGMGIVWKAKDPELNRLVALKALSPTLTTNATARERFLLEARAMAALENENILPIYGVFQDDQPWFAMPFVEGGSLQDALDAKLAHLADIPFLENLAQQMANALNAAHQAGTIHRDIKPANILLDHESDRMWLTDFGIARTTENPGLTYGNAVAGTPRYMSPEQASGEHLDERTDLFSLGSVLYHSATGRPPFEGENSTAIIQKLKTAKPTKIRKLNPDLPAWFTELVTDLLKKDRNDRPSSAQEVLDRLARKKSKRTIPLWILALTIIGAISLLFAWPSPTATVSPDTSAPPTGTSPAPSSPSIILQETGEHFSDLHTAVNEAPNNATLILSGHFLLEKPLITRKGQGLHLRAAEGTTPIITSRVDTHHSIMIKGPASAHGINFVNDRGGEQVSLLTAFESPSLEVTHCHFENRNPKRLIWSIHAYATQKTTIKSCAFRGKKLFAALLYDSKDAATATDEDLIIRDSTMDCRGVIFCRSRFPKSRFSIELHNNTVRTDTLFESSIYNQFRPTKFIVENNKLHHRTSTIVMGKSTLDYARGALNWKGLNNTYQTDPPFLGINRPEPHHITFSTAREDFPGVSESGSRRSGEKTLFEKAQETWQLFSE